MEREERLSAREVERIMRQYGTGQGWSDANRTWGSAAGVRSRYPLLSSMETMLRIVGWLAVAGGVLLTLFQVFPWFTCIFWQNRMGAASCGVAMLILAPMIGAFASGFCLIAFGEVIGVFRGIEGNTYQMLSRIEQIGLQSRLTGEGRGS